MNMENRVNWKCHALSMKITMSSRPHDFQPLRAQTKQLTELKDE